MSILKNNKMHYCPGCGHIIIHRLIAEAIDELKIAEKTIGIAPVGCAVLAYDYFNIDMIESAHGRPPAVATGLKRCLPDKVIFAYQGDGDLAAIGTAEIIHAVVRAENISVFFINNATYGMTGGQLAPTTIIGQRTTTTKNGRQVSSDGYPLKVAELISSLDGASFVARVSVDDATNIKIAKEMVIKSFTYQLTNKGFSMIEFLSSCPTNWGLSVKDSLQWLRDNLIPLFPLGVIKDVYATI